MRVFNENGRWNSEALSVARELQPHIEECFDILAQRGFNPREAGILIEHEIKERTIMGMLRL